MISPERVYQNLHEIQYLITMLSNLLLHSSSFSPYLCNFDNHCVAADNNNKEVIPDSTTKTFIVIVAAVFYTLLSSPPLFATASAQFDYWPTHGWRTTSPEEQGMNSDILVDMIQTIRDQELNVDSITIIRNGFVVMDSYFYPFPDNTKHNMRSASKSVMSILIGIAIEKEYIRDVNQPALSFFPDKTIANMDENKKKITVENLLTMTTGLGCIDGYRHKNKGLYEMRRSSDWAQYVLDLPMTEAPGDRFEYCSGATYLLSAILQKTTGMRSLDFARKYMFAPLGITDASWQNNPQGIDYGYDQLLLTPRDMAKIGWLYLNKGVWDGSQVVSSAWVIDSTREHVEAGTISDHYGYQWWIDEGYYMAVGSGGQFIFISPKESIVAVFTSAAPMLEKFLKVKSLFKSHILASAVSFHPLPFNLSDQKRLDELLVTVRTPPAKRPLSPMPKISKTVSGRTYVFGTNQLGLESLTLTFPPNSDVALMKQVFWGKARKLSVGLDNVFRITKANGRIYAYKGTWQDDNVFIYTFRYIDDANFGDVRLEFKDDELIYDAHSKTNKLSYHADGKLSEDSKAGWLAGKMAAAKNWVKKLVAGKPERSPDVINKSDILGSWKGMDTFRADLTFNFKEDDSFIVIRNPSSLGRPSTGKYTISGTKISGEADTNVAFTVEKFGDEISGKWVYNVNGVSATFTLKKQ